MGDVDAFIFKADTAQFLGQSMFPDAKRAVSDCAKAFVMEYAARISGLPAESLVYVKDSRGKPYIEGIPLHFNVSHCGNVILVAFSDEKIGVDIELVREFSSLAVRKCFTSAESDYLNAAEECSERNKRFFEIWTVKEAFLKCIGVGLSGGFNFDTVTGGNLSSVISSEKLGCARVFHYSGEIFMSEGDMAVRKISVGYNKKIDFEVSICGKSIKKVSIKVV